MPKNNQNDTEPIDSGPVYVDPTDSEPIYEDVTTLSPGMPQAKLIEKSGRIFLMMAAGALLLGLGLPLLVIHFIKMPMVDQLSFFLGISYEKLIFIFFVTSAIFFYMAFFFIKPKPFSILIVFGLSLFCCFPLIYGLKNNLTLQAAFIDLRPFTNWPFFLKPTYILIEFLLPLGVFLYIILLFKVRSFKKVTRIAYGFTSIYLAVAAILGLSVFTQAKQPNLMAFLMMQHQKQKMIDQSREKYQSFNPAVENREIDAVTDKSPKIFPPPQNPKTMPMVSENPGQDADRAIERVSNFNDRNNELLEISRKLDQILLSLAPGTGKPMETDPKGTLSKPVDKTDETIDETIMDDPVKTDEPLAPSEDVTALFKNLHDAIRKVEDYIKDSPEIIALKPKNHEPINDSALKESDSKATDSNIAKFNQINTELKKLSIQVEQLMKAISESNIKKTAPLENAHSENVQMNNEPIPKEAIQQHDPVKPDSAQ